MADSAKPDGGHHHRSLFKRQNKPYKGKSKGIAEAPAALACACTLARTRTGPE
jgi:hypothetical protein